MFHIILKKNNLIVKITTLISVIIKLKMFTYKNTHVKNNYETQIGILLKEILTNLGHLYIKLGQLISVRQDILPVQITNELKKLREQNKPIDYREIKNIIEKNFNKKITTIFNTFNEKPIAVGSVAQIHECTMEGNKKKLVIKIIKPNILKKTKTILFITRLCVTFFIFLFKKTTMKNYISNLLNQIEEKLITEINLENEIKNAFLLKKNFKYNKYIQIPKIYKNLSNKNMIVMDKVYGIPLDSVKKLKTHNYNLKKIASTFVEIFFLQVFRDNFFHADLHPGNIWITKRKKNNFKFTILDFGIMGTLTKEDQAYMVKNLAAFTTKNYKEIAKLHIESGYITENVCVKDLEKNIKLIFAPILNKPLQQIPFRKTIKKIAELIKKYKMKIKPQFFLFQKTLLTVEGLSRQIYPDLLMLPIIKPIVKRWSINNFSFVSFFEEMKKKFYVKSYVEKNEVIKKKKIINTPIINIFVYTYLILFLYFTTTT